MKFLLLLRLGVTWQPRLALNCSSCDPSAFWMLGWQPWATLPKHCDLFMHAQSTSLSDHDPILSLPVSPSSLPTYSPVLKEEGKGGKVCRRVLLQWMALAILVKGKEIFCPPWSMPPQSRCFKGHSREMSFYGFIRNLRDFISFCFFLQCKLPVDPFVCLGGRACWVNWDA